MPRKRKDKAPKRLNEEKRQKLTWNLFENPDEGIFQSSTAPKTYLTPKASEPKANTDTTFSSLDLNLSKNMIRSSYHFDTETNDTFDKTMTCLIENVSAHVLNYTEEIFIRFLENLTEGTLILAYKKGLYTRNKTFECFISANGNYIAIEFDEQETIHALMSKKFTLKLKQKDTSGHLIFKLYLKLNTLPILRWPGESWKTTNFNICLANLMEKYYNIPSYCKLLSKITFSYIFRFNVLNALR